MGFALIAFSRTPLPYLCWGIVAWIVVVVPMFPEVG